MLGSLEFARCSVDDHGRLHLGSSSGWCHHMHRVIYAANALSGEICDQCGGLDDPVRFAADVDPDRALVPDCAATVPQRFMLLMICPPIQLDDPKLLMWYDRANTPVIAPDP